MKSFEDLGVKQPLLGLVSKEFNSPTEIQERTIPLVLKGVDVIAGSETGSGKTLAFSVGIIQDSEIGKGIQSLILAPTRELAEQVARAIMKFSKHKRLEVVFIYGGVSIDRQIKKLKEADIVVGTPGRVLDHIRRKTIDLSKVKTLIIDEADRMFDMGFFDDVSKIIRACPVNRQTLLFSATITGPVERLCGQYMKNPVQVSANPFVDPKKLRQVYYDVPNSLKIPLLVHLLKKEKRGLVMVFCNSRRRVDFISKNLRLAGVKAQPIHGGFAQNKRSKVMQLFNAAKVEVLVCTDVAARGLDIPGVTHIYNYEIPHESKQYLHRIGRTARAGNEGIAVNLLSGTDHDNFTRVLREYDVDVVRMDTPKLERIELKSSSSVRRPRRFSRRSGRR